VKVSFFPEAKNELQDASAFYRQRDQQVSQDFENEFARALEHMVDFPELASPLSAHFHRKLLRKFPYFIISHALGSEISIIAVAHTSRHPDYWKKRL
jgi:plasmid stabilization system protein ParE